MIVTFLTLALLTGTMSQPIPVCPGDDLTVKIEATAQAILTVNNTKLGIVEHGYIGLRLPEEIYTPVSESTDTTWTYIPAPGPGIPKRQLHRSQKDIGDKPGVGQMDVTPWLKPALNEIAIEVLADEEHEVLAAVIVVRKNSIEVARRVLYQETPDKGPQYVRPEQLWTTVFVTLNHCRGD